MKNLLKVSAASSLVLAPLSAFALDTTAIVTELGTAVTDVTAVFAAMSAVIGVMFIIMKVRQLLKS